MVLLLLSADLDENEGSLGTTINDSVRRIDESAATVHDKVGGREQQRIGCSKKKDLHSISASI